jgi:hypothetical protein
MIFFDGGEWRKLPSRVIFLAFLYFYNQKPTPENLSKGVGGFKTQKFHTQHGRPIFITDMKYVKLR